jgi:hypothetical protein
LFLEGEWHLAFPNGDSSHRNLDQTRGFVN